MLWTCRRAWVSVLIVERRDGEEEPSRTMRMCRRAWVSVLIVERRDGEVAR
jgi:hypothetical protein